MRTERRVVNNRVFLLGLDELYREAMKRHERKELLCCAWETANVLSVAPADVPIEGYYTEDEELTEYFRLIRALQDVPKELEIKVANLVGFQRLKQVTESPIFGHPANSLKLLPRSVDALTEALEKTFPNWTVENVTNNAYGCALESSDFSLVALAALSKDPVVLTALRESVVLYAAVAVGCSVASQPEYIWEVDEIIGQRAARFVDSFNNLFGERLPRPEPANAQQYWIRSNEMRIVGRCVRIGLDPSVSPVRHYHWAIDHDARYRPILAEFWDTKIWTTAQYRAALDARDRGR